MGFWIIKLVYQPVVTLQELLIEETLLHSGKSYVQDNVGAEPDPEQPKQGGKHIVDLPASIKEIKGCVPCADIKHGEQRGLYVLVTEVRPQHRSHQNAVPNRKGQHSHKSSDEGAGADNEGIGKESNVIVAQEIIVQAETGQECNPANISLVLD